LQSVLGLYPKVTVSIVDEPAGEGMFELVTVIVVPTGPDVGLLVIEGGGGMTRKLLLGSVKVPPPLTLFIWTHTVYVVPIFVPDEGQVNVPVKLPFETFGFEPVPTL